MTPFFRRSSSLSAPPPAWAAMRRAFRSSIKCFLIAIKSSRELLCFGHAEFHQRPVRRFGVQERHPFLSRAFKGLFVNQPAAGARGAIQFPLDVIGTESNVVNPLAKIGRASCRERV